MSNLAASCTLNLDQILDVYYLENRRILLDLAAFLDRLDRARDVAAPDDDFRVTAMRRGIEVLSSNSVRRARDIQMILSDPSDWPTDGADRNPGRGAFNPAAGDRNSR